MTNTFFETEIQNKTKNPSIFEAFIHIDCRMQSTDTLVILTLPKAIWQEQIDLNSDTKMDLPKVTISYVQNNMKTTVLPVNYQRLWR